MKHEWKSVSFIGHSCVFLLIGILIIVILFIPSYYNNNNMTAVMAAVASVLLIFLGLLIWESLEFKDDGSSENYINTKFSENQNESSENYTDTHSDTDTDSDTEIQSIDTDTDSDTEIQSNAMEKVHLNPFHGFGFNIRCIPINGVFHTWIIAKVHHIGMIDKDSNRQIVWARVHFYCDGPIPAPVLIKCRLSDQLRGQPISIGNFVVVEYNAYEEFDKRNYFIIKINSSYH